MRLNWSPKRQQRGTSHLSPARCPPRLIDSTSGVGDIAAGEKSSDTRGGASSPRRRDSPPDSPWNHQDRDSANRETARQSTPQRRRPKGTVGRGASAAQDA